MKNVQVRCCFCKGDGKIESWRVVNGRVIEWGIPTDPFHFVNCPPCNGFGVLIATELMAVTQWKERP